MRSLSLPLRIVIMSALFALMVSATVMVATPTARAETRLDQLRAQIEQLIQIVEALQAQLAARNGGETSTEGGFAFRDIEVGDTVQTTDSLKVRSEANPSAAILGVAPTFTRGTVQAGPAQAGGYMWWKVTYNSGITGWSAENWLRVVGSSAADDHDHDHDDTAAEEVDDHERNADGTDVTEEDHDHSDDTDPSTDSTTGQADDCHTGSSVSGALPDQAGPVYCNLTDQGGDTSESDGNSWLDEFDHGLSFASFAGLPYSVFPVGSASEEVTWRHMNHWMVDISLDWDSGGSMMRPNKTFTFEDGKFVVEGDFAASHPDYREEVWGEFDVSLGSKPNSPYGGLYGYDHLSNNYTLGCRIQSGQVPTCAFMDPKKGRLWEMSFFQHVGTDVWGGYSSQDDYWRECEPGGTDAQCRDRFRMELTRTSLTFYVNGKKYFEQTGIPPLPEAFYNGDLYVYYSSMQSRHGEDVTRYHWDRIAVNPSTGPTAAPGYGE